MNIGNRTDVERKRDYVIRTIGKACVGSSYVYTVHCTHRLYSIIPMDEINWTNEFEFAFLDVPIAQSDN